MKTELLQKKLLPDVKKLLLKHDITVYQFVKAINDTRFWLNNGILPYKKIKKKK